MSASLGFRVLFRAVILQLLIPALAVPEYRGRHSRTDSDTTTEDSSLRKLIGWPVASDSRYDYSPAMRAYASRQPVWTKQALNDFVADPQALVPENEMGFSGMVDPAERRAPIEYLSTK